MGRRNSEDRSIFTALSDWPRTDRSEDALRILDRSHPEHSRRPARLL